MTNPNTSLATIKEKVAALAAPDATLADIGNNLGYLWDQAAKNNDDIAKEYLSAAWERTQALAVNTSAANAVATAALETAVEIAEQHADLIRAIDNMDYTNPHIAELIEAVEESTYEWLSYNDEFTEGIHDSEPGVTAEMNGHLGDTPADDIDTFLHIVLGDSDVLPDEMNAELVEFINMFIPACREYWYVERKKQKAELERHNAEIAAKRAADQKAS